MNNFFNNNDQTRTAEPKIEQPAENPMLEQPAERPLLSSEISEQLVLEHDSYKRLAEELAVSTKKAEEYRDSWLRAQAELKNVQTRAERDVANAHKFALEKFAYELLTIVDNLERSLASKAENHEALKDFYAGIELTLKSFLEMLQKFGITQINPLNEKFTPEQHTAIMTREEPNAEPNKVLEVVQKGYWLKDRLLRPALVIVAK